MTTQGISIVDVENLKINSHCNAIVSMMEKDSLAVLEVKMNISFLKFVFI